MEELADIRARLSAIERTNRLLKLFLGIAGLACLATVFGWASRNPPVPELIKAHAVAIVSKDGKTLVTMGYDSWMPGGSVVVYDKNGERRGWIRGGPSGGNVGIVGSNTEPNDMSAILGVWRHNANLILTDNKSDYFTSYGLEKDTAFLVIHDKKGDRQMKTLK